MSNDNRKQRAKRICTLLARAYPDSTCALRHNNAFELLVATVLSAQTTDTAVNRVTPGLFAEFSTPEAMAGAPEGAIEAHINSIGLWRNKAKFLRGLSQMLVDRFDGEVPETVAELTQLPGVARKTATATLGTAMGIQAGITVDTHMLRIMRLLELSDANNADKMSKALEPLIPRDQWRVFTHRVIDHGRMVCVARRPRCGVCPLAKQCPSAYEPAIGYRPGNDENEPASAKQVSWLALQAADPST